jgi:hypothetical protein
MPAHVASAPATSELTPFLWIAGFALCFALHLLVHPQARVFRDALRWVGRHPAPLLWLMASLMVSKAWTFRMGSPPDETVLLATAPWPDAFVACLGDAWQRLALVFHQAVVPPPAWQGTWPGRIHHCMRLIGQAERALEKMCKRATERVAFGRTVAEQGVTRERIAEARIMIDGARFMVLHAAWKMDKVGNKIAQKEIAMIKVLAPNMACQVIDWAMQVHGGGGVTDRFGLANMYAHARTLRFADGPDEVHRNAIAKLELAEQTSVAEALAGRKR